jgi:hypothetical protein
MLLELTVYYYPDDFNPYDEDNLKTKPNMLKGIVVINTDHVVAFSPHDNGETMIRFTNGDVFQSTMKFKAFLKIMEGNELSRHILTSGDN